MTDSLRETCPTPDRPEPESDAWDVFALRLSAYLSTMTDPGDRLVLLVPGHDLFGPTAYAEITGTDEGTGLLVETAGGDLLERPTSEAPQVTARLCAGLRDGAHVPHPGLLSATATGPSAVGLAVLRLTAATDVPCEAFPVPRDGAQLTRLLTDWLTERYGPGIDGGVVPIDADGDLVLNQYDQTFWVRIRPKDPAIDIFTCLVTGVRSRRQAAIEVGLLNRDHPWTRWVLRGENVWLHALVPALPWVQETMDDSLDRFLEALLRSRDDLQLRLGGTR